MPHAGTAVERQVNGPFDQNYVLFAYTLRYLVFIFAVFASVLATGIVFL